MLRLRVSPATPEGALWLYLHPAEALRLQLTWERGPENGPVRKTFRPTIDFARSGGSFHWRPNWSSLEFALEEIPGDGNTISARLRPLFEGLETLSLPPLGMAGQIHLATATGSEIRQALLLPPPQEMLC